MSSSSTAAAGDPSPNSIATLPSDLIQSSILTRLDGPTLFSASTSSPQFLSLSSDDSLWRHLCNSNWPSTAHPFLRRTISDFPSSHRSFFSDAFPARRLPNFQKSPLRSPELISAVDLKFNGQIILSKVLQTETKSNWFLSTPFRLDLLVPKESLTPSLDLGSRPEDATSSACLTRATESFSLTWILIDGAGKRSINMASKNPVEVRRHWHAADDDDIQLRFATIMTSSKGGLLQCAVIVTLTGNPRAARVKEVSLHLEDMEGKIVSGGEGLEVIGAAMEGEKWRREVEIEREEYERFVRRKERYRERKQRRERGVDMVCVGAGIAIFVIVVYFCIVCR